MQPELTIFANFLIDNQVLYPKNELFCIMIWQHTPKTIFFILGVYQNLGAQVCKRIRPFSWLNIQLLCEYNVLIPEAVSSHLVQLFQL